MKINGTYTSISLNYFWNFVCREINYFYNVTCIHVKYTHTHIYCVQVTTTLMTANGMTSNQACFMHCKKLSGEPKTQKLQGDILPFPFWQLQLMTLASTVLLWVKQLLSDADLEVHFQGYVTFWSLAIQKLSAEVLRKLEDQERKETIKKRRKNAFIFFPDWTDVEGYIWFLHKIITEKLFLWLKTKRFYLLVNLNDANLNQIFISLLISHPCSTLVSYESIDYTA